MGYYVNPPEETKEEWLNKHGKVITAVEAREVFSNNSDYLPVVLVDNFMFTAAAIAYSPQELEEFLREDDIRPRKIYLVSREDLRPYYSR